MNKSNNIELKLWTNQGAHTLKTWHMRFFFGALWIVWQRDSNENYQIYMYVCKLKKTYMYMYPPHRDLPLDFRHFQ